MIHSLRKLRRRVTKATLALIMISGSVLIVSPPQVAGAQENPYQRGPDPTQASIEAPQGPFDVDTTTVSSLVSGFGGGTIYYPTDTSQGTFGAVAVAPGWTENQSALSWLGPRLASQGFVVFTIDVNNTLLDFPDSRGDQLRAALDYLTSQSEVADRIDPERTAVMGHSMGGGGSLAAADDDPSIDAAIPLSGWHTNTNWSGVSTPTLVIGAENDLVAGVSSHSIPFYESVQAEKAYLELAGGNHFTVLFDNTLVASQSISWLKRFVDDDTRYEQFLCPAPSGFDISDYRDTCPLGDGSGGGGGGGGGEECAWWDFTCWFS